MTVDEMIRFLNHTLSSPEPYDAIIAALKAGQAMRDAGEFDSEGLYGFDEIVWQYAAKNWDAATSRLSLEGHTPDANFSVDDLKARIKTIRDAATRGGE